MPLYDAGMGFVVLTLLRRLQQLGQIERQQKQPSEDQRFSASAFSLGKIAEMSVSQSRATSLEPRLLVN
jgi:hypothetical protein